MDSLETFLVLAKSAQNRACVALITQVLNHRKIYSLGELLAMPNVQALKGGEFGSHFDLLEIFAFGSYSDYRARTDLPDLSEQMLAKLRKLSVVSLAQRQRVVPYALLQRELDISSTRELEDLIIESIYAGLIKARLDQRQAQLLVVYAQARDQRPQDLDAMIETLERWVQASTAVTQGTEDKMGFLTAQYEADAKRSADADQAVQTARDNFMKQVERDGGMEAMGGRSGGGPDRGGAGRRRRVGGGMFDSRRNR